MRIATWNVNGLRARLDFVIHWLRARQPDVVGLQELKVDEENFPFDELRQEGYHAVLHAQKAWNGVAVLSRRPAQLLYQGLPAQQDLGARLVAAEVEGLEFVSIYCPNGKRVSHPDFARKLEWLDALVRLLDSRLDPSAPLVLCGDFNLCPQPLDSWSEEFLTGSIFHTDEERSRFQKLIQLGLADLYRKVCPEGTDYSWWDYRAGAFHKNQGLRIDFLLATDPVAKRVESVRIDRDYRKKKEGWIASDHAPVIADLAD